MNKQFYKKGGVVSLKEAKAMLQRHAPQGEHLAYINSKEAALLKQHGGSGIMTVAGIPSFGILDSIGDVLGNAADFAGDVIDSPIGRIGLTLLAPQLGLPAWASSLGLAAYDLADKGTINPLSLVSTAMGANGLDFGGVDGMPPTGIDDWSQLGITPNGFSSGAINPIQGVGSVGGGSFMDYPYEGLTTGQGIDLNYMNDLTPTQNYYTGGGDELTYDPLNKNQQLGRSAPDLERSLVSGSGDVGIARSAKELLSTYGRQPGTEPGFFDNLKTVGSFDKNVGISERLDALQNVGSDTFKAMFMNKDGKTINMPAVLSTLAFFPTYFAAKKAADNLGVPFNESQYQANKVDPYKSKYSAMAPKSAFGLMDGGRAGYAMGGMSFGDRFRGGRNPFSGDPRQNRVIPLPHPNMPMGGQVPRQMPNMPNVGQQPVVMPLPSPPNNSFGVMPLPSPPNNSFGGMMRQPNNPMGGGGYIENTMWNPDGTPMQQPQPYMPIGGQQPNSPNGLIGLLSSSLFGEGKPISNMIGQQPGTMQQPFIGGGLSNLIGQQPGGMSGMMQPGVQPFIGGGVMQPGIMQPDNLMQQQPMQHAADGGRIGYGDGGMSNSRVTQLLQLLQEAQLKGDFDTVDIIKAELYSMKKANGGRIGYEDGKLVIPQEGPNNKIIRLQMEKAAKQAQAEYAQRKIAEQLMDKNYKEQSMYDWKRDQKELFDAAPEEGYLSLPEPVPPTPPQNEGVLSIKLTPAQKKAHGGMMDHPIRMLKGGTPELDLRAKGGYIPYGVKEKADDVPAMLSKNEFVFTADAVKGAGGGSVNKGAVKMYKLMKSLEKKTKNKR